MAIVGRNGWLLGVHTCIYVRARPLTGALAPRRKSATDNSFYGSRKCRPAGRPAKIGRTRRGLNWSRDSRNRIATATITSGGNSSIRDGYLIARRGRFKEPDYYTARALISTSSSPSRCRRTTLPPRDSFLVESIYFYLGQDESRNEKQDFPDSCLSTRLSYACHSRVSSTSCEAADAR